MLSIRRIDVNLKSVTYCNAMAEGGEEEWQFGWSQYRASEVASERDTLLSALTCSKEVWLLNRCLNMVLCTHSATTYHLKVPQHVHISRGRSQKPGQLQSQWLHMRLYWIY